MTKLTSSMPLVARRDFLRGGAAVVGGAAATSLISVAHASSHGAEVSMQLGWLASNGILGEVVAKSLGYYDEMGIELSVTPGGPEVDGVESVAAGRASVGHLSESASLLLARSVGVPLKAFAAGYQKLPFTYISLANNPIRTPLDMVGQTIATQPTAVFLLRALLAKNGISEEDVEVVSMGSDMGQLLTGQVAAVTGWHTNTNALKILGEGWVDMMLWDAGIQLYANVYCATDETLRDHSDVLTRFLTGSARGWGYARQNPQAAAELLVAEYPDLDLASELEAVGPVLGFSFNDATQEHGWAAMNEANWQAQIDIFNQLGQFEGDVPGLGDIMTNEILAATEAVRRQVAA